jgi:hypothetical protein
MTGAIACIASSLKVHRDAARDDLEFTGAAR